MKQIEAAFESYLSRSTTLMDERAKAGTVPPANAGVGNGREQRRPDP